jgi:hypothetical protein
VNIDRYDEIWTPSVVGSFGSVLGREELGSEWRDGQDRSMPERVRLERKRGWRKPAGAVVVARPSRWGNPFRVGTDGDRAECVARFREAFLSGGLPFGLDDVRRQLAGRDLACWCPTDGPCHADVLLVAANRAEAEDGKAVGRWTGEPGRRQR